MLRTVLERALTNYMSKQGLRFEGGSMEEGVLRFVGNGFAYVVKVLDEMGGRPELISAALESAFWAAKGERAYILVPRNVASMDELMAIRLHGIGLLLHGTHGLEELPPMVKHIGKDETQTSVKYENASHVIERIEKLERFVQRINEIDTLVSRLERLEALYGKLSDRLLAFGDVRPSHVKTAVADKSNNSADTKTELPSFMKDNPWLDILAEKGPFNA
ncbi:MAG: hypothetical protein QXI81_05940 [Nitrososphaerota archaeon]